MYLNTKKFPSYTTENAIRTLESKYELTSRAIASWMGMTAGALRARLSKKQFVLSIDEKLGFWEGLNYWLELEIHTIRMNVDDKDTILCACGCGERDIKKTWNHKFKRGHYRRKKSNNSQKKLRPTSHS